MIFYQRDIDGELAVALDKFLGAIQRIDYPVTLPPGTLAKRRNSPLLRQNRGPGAYFAQARHEHSMGGKIRRRDRRFIVFGLHPELIAIIHVENCLSRPLRQRNYLLQQRPAVDVSVCLATVFCHA